ncbi:IS630 family transposase, partial [Salmonella enterica subsp. enterica]|nr:IS630 family transposase [Salmonella enterica subsp. enterica serovar Infantis]EDL4480376.1 IS630 family transposase [Salmonella enterica subsp. enterica serovar Infantis]
MLLTMKIFITDQQKAELERLHDSSRDGRVRDRIKAILLASEGWSSAMIAQALRLHQTTVDHHISEFLNKGKLKPENGGSDSKLSAEQTAFLISQLTDNLFHHARDVIAFVARTWNIVFSVPGMNKWLHRNGFTYKKPSGVPHKFSEEKQRQFIEYYEELKETVGDEPVLFIDGVHPTQATKISYGWICKGQKKAVKTTGSRTRLNIMGALNLKTPEYPLICEYKTINEYNVSRFFNEIRKVYPDYNQKIHVILDGA